jgi:DNA repair exonuclease SbcCD ATPase subunit
MSVILKKLEFSNMFSYGEKNSIALNKERISQLVAENGVGKTSISLAIQELLFNKNVKGLKKSDILNRYSKSKTWEGRIEFTVDEDEYVVISKRTGASTNVTLLKNGVDISEHKVLDTYKLISDIIGRDFETFSQLTYQSSTDSLEFLKATDTNRKKFLVNLFNLTRYLEIGDDLKVKISEREKDLNKLQGELKTIVDFITNNPIPEKTIEKQLPIVDETLVVKISDLSNQLREQKTLCDKIDKNNLHIKELNSLSFDMTISKPIIDESIYQEQDKIKASINKIDANITKAKKQLSSLDTSDHCYACKQPIDNSKSKELVDQLTSEISMLTTERKECENTLNSINTTINEYNSALKIYTVNQQRIDRFSQLSQLIDNSLPTEYPNYTGISKQLKQLEEEYAWQKRELETTQKYNDSVKIRNAKIEGLKEQLLNFKARQMLLNDDILKVQDEIVNLGILRKAFSTSGIVAYKLENVTKQLEDSINYYLSTLSDGQFQVIFRLNSDKLNVIIVNNGIEVAIESLSGGEFSRVQTSVLLAVRNTLSNLGSKSINLLFLDEIMGVLDDSGKEKLFEVLNNETNLNVFLISHEYTHPLIPKIEIEKKNNISSIRA